MTEVKSRYEVISDLEQQKRDLITQRDSLKDQLNKKKLEFINMERQKSDTITAYDRKLDDMKVDMKLFEETMEEKKTTIKELISGVEASLERFSQLQKA